MKHQKRLSAPKHYPIERKNGKYVVVGKGPHKEEDGIPVTVLLREVLGYAETAAEVSQILNEENVVVNGKVVKEPGYVVGFMDSISIDKVGEEIRVLLDKNGLVFKPVEDVEKRVFKVLDKRMVKGGAVQLNLDAGENLLVEEDDYSTKSSIILDLESKDVEKHIPFEEGNLAYISGGAHIGSKAKIKEIIQLSGSQDNKVVLVDDSGEEFETVEKYVFMVGEDETEVEL